AVSLALATPSATIVTVRTTEYRFVLSRESFPAGPVTFRVVNAGRVAHDFAVAGQEKTPTVAPGKTAILRLTLKPGTYRYYCTQPRHVDYGMHGSFRVTARTAPPRSG